jgi:hypothetical protein
MSANKKIETILIELDALLDTRLGTLRQQMGVEYAQRILTLDYITREIDAFEGIETSVFQEMYAARNEETLKCSVVTALVTRLKDLTTFLSELAVNAPEYDGIRLAVNTYPYRLSKAVLRDIGKSVSVWTGGLIPVELVNITPQDLTPIHVKSHFAMLFMYDYGSWIETQTVAFHETLIPEIHLVAPALYFSKKPDAKELKDLVRQAAHPFQATMMFLTPMVGLELVDAKWFSIVSLPNKAP